MVARLVPNSLEPRRLLSNGESTRIGTLVGSRPITGPAEASTFREHPQCWTQLLIVASHTVLVEVQLATRWCSMARQLLRLGQRIGYLAAGTELFTLATSPISEISSKSRFQQI